MIAAQKKGLKLKVFDGIFLPKNNFNCDEKERKQSNEKAASTAPVIKLRRTSSLSHLLLLLLRRLRHFLTFSRNNNEKEIPKNFYFLT